MNELQKTQLKVQELEKQVALLTEKVSQLSGFQANFSGRVVINQEVQYLQKVYDKNGDIVTEINP